MTTRRRSAIVLAAALLAFGLPACGGDDDDDAAQTAEPAIETETQEAVTGEEGAGGMGDPEAGAEVFASAGCGGCHALDAAGTSGTVGPNLDETQPGYDRIVEQVTNGGGAMPAFKDRLSEEEIQNVAAFVFESTR